MQNLQGWGLQTFPIKSHLVNISHFVGQVLLQPCNSAVRVKRPQTTGKPMGTAVQIKLYL